MKELKETKEERKNVERERELKIQRKRERETEGKRTLKETDAGGGDGKKEQGLD